MQLGISIKEDKAGGAETSPEWTHPLTQLHPELALVLDWGPYKSQLIYWYCFHLSVLYSSLVFIFSERCWFPSAQNCMYYNTFSFQAFAHNFCTTPCKCYSALEFRCQQHAHIASEVYKIVSKKELHKETSCGNLKIWGQCGNAKIKWKMDKNTLKIASEKGGACLEKKQLLPYQMQQNAHFFDSLDSWTSRSQEPHKCKKLNTGNECFSQLSTFSHLWYLFPG